MWNRKPSVAGAFYPGDKNTLSKDIQSYLDPEDMPDIEGELLGLISPHAGYVYSGPIAGFAYSLLKKKNYKLAVVLAPSHSARFDGASIIPEGLYETPLGNVKIESDIGNKLVSKPGFTFIKEIHENEHSLEVQVPFLQSVLDDFSILPIVIGTTDLNICKKIADSIYTELKEYKFNFIIIISTDLSHFHSYDKANKIDNNFIESIKDLDEEIINNTLISKKGEACGHGPILTGIHLCKKLNANKIDILKYANSGDTAGDKSRVVGYLSAAILEK